jgi:hypothetical protein
LSKIHPTKRTSKTRKILAAFYTKVEAGEILAGLTIKNAHDTIWDVACGSGTLLVSGYRQKKMLYENLKGRLTKNDNDALHKSFIEEQITGTDLMPFACHLTALSLSSLNLSTPSNKMRISIENSLKLYSKLHEIDPVLKRASNEISNEINKVKRVQQLLDDFSKENSNKSESQNLSKAEEDSFPMHRVKTILMNPPFTDRNKLPKKYREDLFKFKNLGDICGNEINLWGYFLALADKLIMDNGRIGAIIPINFLRGEATQQIREYFLKNYHIEYIVKPVGDFAFSEDANFKDIMVIAEKRKSEPNELTAVVLIKESLDGLPMMELRKIKDEILSVIPGNEYSTSDFDMSWVSQKKMLETKDNLMPFLYANSQEKKRLIDDFIEVIISKSSKISLINKNDLKEGIFLPKNYSKVIYLTRNSDNVRIERAYLSFDNEGDNSIEAKSKDGFSVKIDKKAVTPALRSQTGIRTIDITSMYDYIVYDNYLNFDSFMSDLEQKLKIKKDSISFNWKNARKYIDMGEPTHLIIPDKIRLNSKNTYVVALFSENKIKPSNLSFSIKNLELNDAKILCLSLNSIVTILQYIKFKSEAFGDYPRLSRKDWTLIYQIDPQKLDSNERDELIKTFDEVRNYNFPCIVDQLKNLDEKRLKIDRVILKILGMDDTMIEKKLPIIYESVLDEL